jgi:hypothetical protein
MLISIYRYRVVSSPVTINLGDDGKLVIPFRAILTLRAYIEDSVSTIG